MPMRAISSSMEEGKKQGVSATGKATWVRAMASSEWSMVRKVSGRKRVLKSWRRAGITRTGYRVQGAGTGGRSHPEGGGAVVSGQKPAGVRAKRQRLRGRYLGRGSEEAQDRGSKRGVALSATVDSSGCGKSPRLGRLFGKNGSFGAAIVRIWLGMPLPIAAPTSWRRHRPILNVGKNGSKMT